MSEFSFTQHDISVNGGRLAAWSIGEGTDVIFLHGGPGDTHDYMKRMAEPLLSEFRCIFFDQRGTGGSNNFERQADQFRIEKLFEDLLSVKRHFNSISPSLVGHSWGAMYALFACMRHSSEFKKAALISMGPLDSEMGEAVGEHLVSVLNDSEKAIWHKLRSERNRARDSSDFESVLNLDKEMMRLRVKAWVFTPSLRDVFLKEYFQDPPPDREVNKWIWGSIENWFSWDREQTAMMPIWLCVGENDSVPISQFEKLQRSLPNSTLSVFKKCGHIPWMEHPDKFYSELRQFLIEEAE